MLSRAKNRGLHDNASVFWLGLTTVFARRKLFGGGSLDIKKAFDLGKASYVTSVAGIVVVLIIIFILLIVVSREN